VLLVTGQWWLALRAPRFLERWPAPGVTFGNWEPLTDGIEYARASLVVPRLLKCHALRIDLRHPGLELVVNPSAEVEPGWVKSAFPTSWLRSVDAVAAINATPFSPEAIFPGTAVKLEGLAVSGGSEWAAKMHNLDALVQRTNGQVQFLRGGDSVPDTQIGVGGFLMTLRGGTNVGESSPRDAAATVGVSADGRWMYWLVVDGGQPGYSEGATPRETAEILRQLGASDALNLDGGSSSTLVTATGWSGAQVRNRPRHPAYSGLQRPVGNVLAVRVRKP
jgi:hypothetical protein